MSALFHMFTCAFSLSVINLIVSPTLPSQSSAVLLKVLNKTNYTKQKAHVNKTDICSLVLSNETSTAPFCVWTL